MFPNGSPAQINIRSLDEPVQFPYCWSITSLARALRLMPFAFIFSPPSVFHSPNTNSFLLHHHTGDESVQQTDLSHPARGTRGFLFDSVAFNWS